MKVAPSTVLRFIDLSATVFLGIEGAMAAIDGNLDLFGVMVLSFITALGGGVIRDLLVGAVPPVAISEQRYPIAAFAGGAFAIFLSQFVRQLPIALTTGLDSAGLALFAVSGTAKALDYKTKPFIAILLGTVTGVGGGTIRDIMLARVPAILRVDVYAVAAMIGATVMVVGMRLGVSRNVMMIVGALLCFCIRELSFSQHWNLPRVLGH